MYNRDSSLEENSANIFVDENNAGESLERTVALLKNIPLPPLPHVKSDYSNLTKLFEHLNQITSSKITSIISDEWATGYGINKALEELLGNSVHIIDPDSSSIHSPATGDVIGAVNYAKMIGGYMTNDREIVSNGFISSDGGVLKKPIIMIMNTHTVKAQSNTDSNAIGGLHWQCCVVLPKNYKPKFGNQLDQRAETIFYLDSLHQNVKMPAVFKQILTAKEGYSYVFDSEGTTHTHKIPSLFVNAQVVDGIITNQQLGGEDCGWWGLYNALMVVCTGNITYLQQFKFPSREPAYKLRSLFPNLSQNVGRLRNEKVSVRSNIKLLKQAEKRYDKSFENLIFEGNAEQSIAYAGVIEALSNTRILQGIKSVVGTTTGSLAALLIALGCDDKAYSEKLSNIFMEVINKVTTELGKLENQAPELFSNLTLNYFKEFNKNTATVFVNWAREIIAEKLGNSEATFKDLHDKISQENKKSFFRNLYLVYQDNKIFSFEQTPNIRLTEALLRTISLPYNHEKMRFHHNVKVLRFLITNSTDSSIEELDEIKKPDENIITIELECIKVKAWDKPNFIEFLSSSKKTVKEFLYNLDIIKTDEERLKKYDKKDVFNKVNGVYYTNDQEGTTNTKFVFNSLDLQKANFYLKQLENLKSQMGEPALYIYKGQEASYRRLKVIELIIPTNFFKEIERWNQTLIKRGENNKLYNERFNEKLERVSIKLPQKNILEDDNERLAKYERAELYNKAEGIHVSKETTISYVFNNLNRERASIWIDRLKKHQSVSAIELCCEPLTNYKMILVTYTESVLNEIKQLDSNSKNKKVKEEEHTQSLIKIENWQKAKTASEEAMRLAKELRSTAHNGQKEKVIELLKNGANSTIRDKFGRTALHYAAECGYLEVVKILLNHNSKIIDITDNVGETALHIACTEGYYKIANELCVKAELNLQNSMGQTPLHKATLRRHENICLLLMGRAAARKVSDCYGLSSMDYKEILQTKSNLYNAAKKIHIYSPLNGTIKIQYVLNNSNISQLYQYVQNLHLSKILQGINAGTEFIEVYQGLENEKLQSRLTFVIEIRTPETVLEELRKIEKGVDNKKLRKLVEKPIKLMLKPIKVSTSEAIIGPKASAKDIDINIRLCDIAKDSKALKEAEEYIKQGADFNYRNKHGRTALHYASEEGNIELVKLLLKNKADANIGDNLGKTALHLACNRGQLPVVLELCASNARLNVQDITGKTVLHIAVKVGSKEIVELLLDQGLNPNTRDNQQLEAINYVQEIKDPRRRNEIKKLIKEQDKERSPSKLGFSL